MNLGLQFLSVGCLYSYFMSTMPHPRKAQVVHQVSFYAPLNLSLRILPLFCVLVIAGAGYFLYEVSVAFFL